MANQQRRQQASLPTNGTSLNKYSPLPTIGTYNDSYRQAIDASEGDPNKAVKLAHGGMKGSKATSKDKDKKDTWAKKADPASLQHAKHDKREREKILARSSLPLEVKGSTPGKQNPTATISHAYKIDDVPGVHGYAREREIRPVEYGGPHETKHMVGDKKTDAKKSSKSFASSQGRPSSGSSVGSDKGRPAKSKSDSKSTSSGNKYSGLTHSPVPIPSSSPIANRKGKVTTTSAQGKSSSQPSGGAREKDTFHPPKSDDDKNRAVAANMQDDFDNYNLKPKKKKKKSPALLDRNNMDPNQLDSQESPSPEPDKSSPPSDKVVEQVDLKEKIAEAERDAKLVGIKKAAEAKKMAEVEKKSELIRRKDKDDDKIEEDFNLQRHHGTARPGARPQSRYSDRNNLSTDFQSENEISDTFNEATGLTDSQAMDVEQWQEQQRGIVSKKIKEAERDPKLVGSTAAAAARKKDAKAFVDSKQGKGPLKSLNRLAASETQGNPTRSGRDFASPTQLGNPLIPWLQNLHGRHPLGRDMKVSVVRDMLHNELAHQFEKQSKKASGMSEFQLGQITSALGNVNDNQLMALVDLVLQGTGRASSPDEDEDPISPEHIRNQFDDFQSNLRETYAGDYMVRRPSSRGMTAAAQNSNRFDQSSKREGQGQSYEIGGTQSLIADVVDDEEYMQDVIAGLQESDMMASDSRRRDTPQQPEHRRRRVMLFLVPPRQLHHHHPHHHHAHHHHHHHAPSNPPRRPADEERDHARGHRDVPRDRRAPPAATPVAPAPQRAAPRYDAGLGALFRMAPAFTPAEWRDVERDPPGFLGTMGRRGPPGRWMESRHFTGVNYEGLWNLAYRLGSVQNRGLTDQQIRRLPREKYALEKTLRGGTEEVNCTICLTPFEKKVEVIRLPCGHCFHTDCITSWVMKNATCPICRAEVKER